MKNTHLILLIGLLANNVYTSENNTQENKANDRLYLADFVPSSRTVGKVGVALAGMYILDQQLGNMVTGSGAPRPGYDEDV